MKHQKLILLTAFLIICNSLSAQISVPFDSDQWLIQRGEIVDFMGQKSLKGNASLKDVEFKNGIIEFDMNFTGNRGFAGINFRMQTPANGEHFYIRPHKSNQVDALQYTPIVNGISSWQLYNGDGYTSAANLPPNEWLHIKLEMLGSQARIFLGESETPALVMNYLQHGESKGALSLFGPMNGTVHFANFSYTETDDLKFEPAETQTLPMGIVEQWQLSQPISFNKVDMNEHPASQDLNLTWQDVHCDKTGLVDIGKFTPRSGPEPDVIFAKTIFKSEQNENRLFTYGYSDAIQIFVNGKLVASSQGYFRSRDPGFQGIAGLFDAVSLPLKKGDNEIMVQLTETFGGWGFYFQDSEYEVLDESITEVWSITKDINVPESVVYDRKRDVLYVSNFSGFSRRGTQTISQVSLEGEVLRYDWITGLKNPTGMQIHDDKLYVVERDAVSEIDIEKGEVINRFTIPEPAFPNDIVVTDDGVIYVSDNDKSTIFKYENNEFTPWLKGKEVGRPNGMFYQNNVLYWGNNADKTFKKIDLNTKKTSVIKQFESVLIDGIKRTSNGDFLLSDYEGVIYRISNSGELKILVDTRASGLKQADFEYIPEKDLIVVPSLYFNSVRAYKYLETK